MEIDFGDNSNDVVNDTTAIKKSSTENITSIDGTTSVDDNGNPIASIDNDVNNSNDKDTNNDDKSNKDNVDTDSDLKPGYVIEVGNNSYTVDEKGNLIDEKGSIFKEAKDVSKWIKQFDVDKEDNDTKDISIETVKNTIGIDITNDDGTPIEFDNSPEGIAAYVNAVIETSRDEYMEAAINTIYQKYPIIEQVLDYYVANNNSLEGFGEIPDRSGIIIDDTNEAQQEIIIRTAWEEQGKKGNVDAYIQYLKSSGTLLAVAKEELIGLQESDKQYLRQIEEEAERKETERIKQLESYWNDVKKVVDSRSIAGYTIPENIIVNKNGQKISVTPNDFFNYIYRVDNEGKSAYQKDLANETPESRRDDELLRAYLKFVGGNYSNLVDMAINNEKVNRLKLSAKKRATSSIRVKVPKVTTNGIDKIDFGIN